MYLTCLPVCVGVLHAAYVYAVRERIYVLPMNGMMTLQYNIGFRQPCAIDANVLDISYMMGYINLPAIWLLCVQCMNIVFMWNIEHRLTIIDPCDDDIIMYTYIL